MTRILAICFALFSCGAALHAQNEEQTRQLVLEKMVFYFVPNPGAEKPDDITTLEIDKVAISNNQDIANPVWTSNKNVGLKNLLIALLRPSSQGGDAKMQRIVRNVLLITGKKVHVFLYGDFDNPVPHDSWDVYCTTTSYVAAHSNASWPCASCFDDRTLDFTGHIGMGAYFCHPDRPAESGGWSSPEDKGTVFIHELVHTQLPLVLESTLGGTPMYGLGGHSFYEMIPSKNSAFNEGIANAFGYRYHFNSDFGMTTWYNNNINLFADNIAGCPPANPAPAKCLQVRLSNLSIAPQASCRANAACYAIRDMPASVLLHNENVTSNMLFQYMRQFNSELILVYSVKRAYDDMANASNYTFAPLFKELIRSGIYFNGSNYTPANAEAQFLPLGILDYYTGYTLHTKAHFERALDLTWDAALPSIDEYWASKRGTLVGYRTNATTWSVQSQLDAFRTHLNVRVLSTPIEKSKGAGN